MLKSKTTPHASTLRRRGRPNTNKPVSPDDTHVEQLLANSRDLLRRRGVHKHCSVEIERRGRWFVLRGRVDSHRTRSQLFGMVPRSNGAQWIVDHLRVDTNISKTNRS